jgi:hypothetical protein
MKLSAVILARSIAFVDINDLSPRGRLFFPALVPLIAQRFGFQVVPTKHEDFDETKGIKFSDGFYGESYIQHLTVWSDGIGIDVRSSTEEGEAILKDALNWLSIEVGLNWTEDLVKRWAYLSQVTFFSDHIFSKTDPALEALSKALSREVSSNLSNEFDFQTTALTLNFDRALRSSPVAPFSIQRRGGVRFDEKKFFSEAPLKTFTHLQILEEYEKNLI